MSKYDTSGLIDAQFEPGSNRRVLKNLLGIKQKPKMDRIEAEAQFNALEKLIDLYDENHCFTAADINGIHKIWLGDIYEWAGQYRQINLSKDGFLFAAANQISKLMVEFEEKLLQRFTPCCFPSMEENVMAIAVIHSELVLIHPFREGNGRAARLLAILMALQANLPPLDFGSIQDKKRQEYFSAIRASLDKNYEPMEQVFKEIIKRTLRI